MCGVTGWIAYGRDLTTERHVAEAMTETLACRGPDGGGLWTGRHALLGHRRLAVIDLPGGRQPMTARTEDGAVTLVYSGECYNFTELRRELRSRGRRFRTESDTEVVLRGYLEWGEGVLERLNGMYAFAIWDERDERLLLARDRLGVKPLYYYPTGDGVLFGSEPKAILANPLVDRAVDLDGLRELFAFTWTPGVAIWRGMREVVPGTSVTVDRSGSAPSRYWRLGEGTHADDLSTAVATVRELLEDIVARQLVSDVPLCVLLSGGLDSSAITALGAARRRADGMGVLRSFTVDVGGRPGVDGSPSASDASYARETAELAGTEHREIALGAGRLADPEVRRAVVAARDLPTGHGDLDSSLYLLFAAIREHSTVALSGESADELFGGYRWYHDPRVREAEMYPWLTPSQSRRLPQVLMLDPALGSALDLGDYVETRYREAVAEVPPVDGLDDLEARTRRLCYLYLTRFMRLLLDRKDRMSMMTGLEVRVPFCDHRLVEYVFATPWAIKSFDGREKSLLRAAVRDVVPRSVAERAKSPYPSTQDIDYLARLQRQARAVLADGHEATALFDVPRLTEVVRLLPERVGPGERDALERLLDVAAWLAVCRPRLLVS